MTLTELRYIVAVARERHFGRAAASCFVSQPTLSVAVKKLEDELGVTLFERSAGDVSLTSTGERVVEQAQRVLEEVQVVKQLAEQGKDPLAGPLRLGIIYTISPYLLPCLIPALREVAPQMQLLLEENYTGRLAEMLKQGEIDAAIVAEPFFEGGVSTMQLYDEPFVVATPKGHPWEALPAIDSSQLAEENVLLLSPGNCFRDHVLQTCPDLNRESLPAGSLQRTLQGSSLTTIRHMVAGGIGVTVLPVTSVTPADDALLTIKPFSGETPTRRVILAWRKNFPRTAAIEAVRTAVLNSGLAGVTFLH
ncbi:LysR family transcriptional regulator, hydrogen peroxide-inducible genes activator [Andreprevotia lacus DSM 23236]|jgi:LysR family hydrogen peroxide-inducible transcriptional activator|uniref:LysR family transcriptional regulator, hydrogen peroxide-inducible genes activator n=1 Tax=Andreprevotia lacus DSM 23236 TaxID=1121001 RepID=A0A1W1XNI0_9NEIS|nr:LysR substrate-binding domain-containing protein [Andreprevotia lacus]SMC25068.1 LysR family transcriptional regulator, hydrogen peroxide-inducible genes activator [Andreprevotia lacus DSM 23236]